mgnify:CR=1 FL=1
MIEYNCRLVDPETQAVWELLETDLLDIFEAVGGGTLSDVDIRFAKGATCCLMLVSGGYPGAYEKGKPISIGDMPEDTFVYHSGTAFVKDELVTAGGRVLGVTATGSTLKEAVSKASEAAKGIAFDGMAYRHDIGKQALEAK